MRIENMMTLTADLFFKQAQNMKDSEDIAYTGELFLLRKIFEYASDLKNSKTWPEFAEKFPAEAMEKNLFAAVIATERYFSEFE